MSGTNHEGAEEALLAEALALAARGRGLTSPNPMVGAVVARGGEVVGRGVHFYAARRHAEIAALEEAGERARGATLYVNLEPCCHTGRTPPCVEAIAAAGVARVVAAMEDPNPRVRGRGFAALRAAGVAVEVGRGEAARAARRLNRAFARWIQTGRPWVTLKAGMSLDGKIAFAPGGREGADGAGAGAADESRWITSPEARAHAQGLRRGSDAILVGIGTALADDPLLTDRAPAERADPAAGEAETAGPRRRALLRVILDSRLRLPSTSRLARSAAEDLVIFCAAEGDAATGARRRELERRGARVETAPRDAAGRLDVGAVLARLGEWEVTSLLVEGGGRVFASFLAADAADRVVLYVSPRWLGESGTVPLLGGAEGDGPRPLEGTERALARPWREAFLKELEWTRVGPDFRLEGELRDVYAEGAASRSMVPNASPSAKSCSPGS